MVLGEFQVVSSFEPSGIHGVFCGEGPAVGGLEGTGVNNVEDGSLRLGDIGVDGTGVVRWRLGVATKRVEIKVPAGPGSRIQKRNARSIPSIRAVTATASLLTMLRGSSPGEVVARSTGCLWYCRGSLEIERCRTALPYLPKKPVGQDLVPCSGLAAREMTCHHTY